MDDDTLEEELTWAVLDVEGVARVYPAPTVLRDPPETLAMLLQRGTAWERVDLVERRSGTEVVARIGVDGEARPAPDAARAAADALLAETSGSVGSVHVTVTRIE